MPIKNKKQWKNLLAKAHLGNSNAEWEVGYCYEKGLITKTGFAIKQKPKQALKWFLLAAKQGNKDSQISLGNILSTSDVLGLEPVFSKAIYWTKKAIKQGSATAAHNLATIYRDLQKPKLAFKWYKESVKMGGDDSLLQIGLCYLSGYGTQQKYKSAKKNFERILLLKPHRTICQRTLENAQYWLSILDLLELNKERTSLSKARNLLESANKDNDHEQANELLNLIGKTRDIRP